jgi:hypothetical protein
MDKDNGKAAIPSDQGMAAVLFVFFNECFHIKAIHRGMLCRQ